MTASRGLPHFIFLSLVLLCFYLPLFVLVIFSFNSRAFPSGWDHFTLQWYQALFKDAELWYSFANSFIVALGSTALCIFLTSCMLYFVSRGGRIRKMIPLFYGNLLFPETAIAVGLVTYFSLMNIPLGLFTIIIAHSIMGLGFMIPVLYVKFQDIDKRILEASHMLGASFMQTFSKVVLPLLRPAMIATGLMVFIISFDDFVFAYFCAGTNAQTLSLFLVATLRYGVSPNINALASILLLFTTILVAIFLVFRKKEKYL